MCWEAGAILTYKVWRYFTIMRYDNPRVVSVFIIITKRLQRLIGRPARVCDTSFRDPQMDTSFTGSGKSLILMKPCYILTRASQGGPPKKLRVMLSKIPDNHLSAQGGSLGIRIFQNTFEIDCGDCVYVIHREKFLLDIWCGIGLHTPIDTADVLHRTLSTMKCMVSFPNYSLTLSALTVC